MSNTISNLQPRMNLDEVSFIRPILIVLLVLYHAFAPWCGAWRLFDGYEPNEVYWWIGKSAYSFMLPMFVFISGYVWAYQRESLNKVDSLKQLAIKKFKRLYIPSLLFSVAYVLLFNSQTLMGKNATSIGVGILSGYAHMWFLPMLLWTFLVTWFIFQIKKNWLRWSIVIGLCGISFLPVPLGISTAFYYIIYFYAGYEALIYASKLKKYTTPRSIAIQWLIFIIAFVLLTMLNESWSQYYSDKSTIIKLIGIISTNAMTKVYGFLGVLALYSTSVYYTDKHQLSDITIKIGAYCFGVYLFQQFILQALYYHTQLPAIVGTDMLPWFGFTITLFVSLLFSYLVRCTKAGRKLI